MSCGSSGIFRWGGKILVRTSGGYPDALAFSEACCCPPCETTCCCNTPQDPEPANGCQFYIRPPYCCTDDLCTEQPIDPNITESGKYYCGGITQVVGYKGFVYNSSQSFIFNNPPNDYWLASVYIQNAPSYLNFSLCKDIARKAWYFLAGCTFAIPVCVFGYVRDPYCPATFKDNCDPCQPIFDDCCGSMLETRVNVNILSTMANYTIVNECPGCGNTPDLDCNPYPPTDCRLGSTELQYLFDYEGCAGFVKKDCCFRTTGTLPNNRRFYNRKAVLASATLVGATQCDGTDNNGGPGYDPVQPTEDCEYVTFEVPDNDR